MILGSLLAATMILPDPERLEPWTPPMPEAAISCLTYGAGFIALPGSESCLRVGGAIWTQLSGSDPGRPWQQKHLLRIDFETRSELAGIPFRSVLRLQQQSGAAAFLTPPPQGDRFDTRVMVDRLYVDLGGLRIGRAPSAWHESMGAGFASGGVTHSFASLAEESAPSDIVSYTPALPGGFHLTLSAERLRDAAGTHLIAVAGVNRDWGGAWLRARHQNWDQAPVNSGFRSVTLQAGLHLLIDPGVDSSLRLAAEHQAYQIPAGTTDTRLSVSYEQRVAPNVVASVATNWSWMARPAAPGSHAVWQHELALAWRPALSVEFRAVIVHNSPALGNASTRTLLRATRVF